MDPCRHVEHEESIDVRARVEELRHTIRGFVVSQHDEVVLAGARKRAYRRCRLLFAKEGDGFSPAEGAAMLLLALAGAPFARAATFASCMSWAWPGALTNSSISTAKNIASTSASPAIQSPMWPCWVTWSMWKSWRCP